MKTILNKIKIHSLTYYFFFLYFICGYIKNALVLFLIIIIHEIGHLIFITLFSYPIEKITIYPFGGVTTINKKINSSILKDIIIAFAGVCFQFIVLFILITYIPFMPQTISIMKKYNYTIGIFNLLPIIPLDGSKIIENVFNYFFSYKKSYYLTIVISIFSILTFIKVNLIFSLNNYLIVTILIYYTLKYKKDFKYVFHKFLLERILYDFPYKKIENHTKKMEDLKREHLHYFKEKNRYVSEREKIKKKFDKNTYFWYDFNVWKGFPF